MKQFLHDIIVEAGQITIDYRSRLSTISVIKKSPKDLVTEADIAVEKFLIDQISERYPQHSILGEESGAHKGNEYRWVIDPIDGTTSFVRNQPFYSVSIALEKNGQTILAAVNAPVLGELFEAEIGKGATLNGNPIHVSLESEMISSVLGTGFACVRSDLEHDNVAYFDSVVRKVTGMRRFGSAAVDLCYVACGRFDGFWEMNLNVYDVAAGILIVTEAGGKVTDFSNGTDGLYTQIVSTNGVIHDDLLAIFKQVDSDSQ